MNTLPAKYKKISVTPDAYKKLNIIKSLNSCTISEAISKMYSIWCETKKDSIDEAFNG